MPRPDVRDERVPELLAAATAVFAEHGFDSGSMSMVADAAGYSKATVYHYFPTKDALIEALTHAVFQDDLAHLERLEKRGLSIRATIAEYVEQLGTSVSRGFDTYRLIVNAYGRALRNHTTRSYLVHHFQRYRDVLQRVCERGKAAGELPESLDSSQFASSLIATIEGSLLLSWIVERDPVESLRRDVSVFVDAAVR